VDGDPTIRILIADPNSLFRKAVRSVLEGETDLEVVGEGCYGAQAVREAEQTRPDVVLIDATLPNCDGARTTALITERVPGCRVLLLSEDKENGTLLEAMCAGASAYLTNGKPLSELIAAIRAVHRGETLVPPEMVGGLLAHLIRRRREIESSQKSIECLTSREKEVLLLLSEGANNAAIAQSLVISPQTARTHVQNLLAKLGMHSRLEAAAFVLQNGVHDDLALI